MIPLKKKILDNGFTKIAKAGPILMPFILRGVADGASSLGNRAMLERYGKNLADIGIDPYDIPGKKQTSWIDPTMVYGIGTGAAAQLLSSLYGDDTESFTPLYLGAALGGAYGDNKTYRKQLGIARDLLEGKSTEDTEYVKTKDYIRKKLEKKK